MKLLFTASFILFISLGVYSQNFQVFVSGGPNYYALVGNSKHLGNDTSYQFNDGGFGFNIGYGVLKEFHKIEISAAIEFSQRQTSRFDTSLDRDEVYNFISLPVQFKFEIFEKTKLILQNRLDYLIHNQKLSLINVDTGDSYLSKIDFGVGGGISYLISRLEFQILGDIGAIWVENRPPNSPDPNNSIKTKSRLVKLNLLYLF